MESTTILLLLLIQATSLFSSDMDSRSSFFKTQENKQLKGFVVKRFDSPSFLSCGRQCLRNVWCTSTKFKLSSKKDGEGTRELNKHDISVVTGNINFAKEEGVIFSLLLKGCQMTSCLNSGSCSPDNTGDVCKSQSKGNSTCKEIYDSNQADGNKAYLLQVGSDKIPVFCHMTSLGSGWTLIMKMDGTKRTFHYTSQLWSNYETFNPDGGKTGFDSQETKLPTYWNTPFTKICLGMKIGQQINFIVINKQASSLYSLIADGMYLATSLGRDTWKWLIGSQTSLQPKYNREGFNAECEDKGRPKARIGIHGNGKIDCKTCDSRIGFGTGGAHDDSNTCGDDDSSYGSARIKAIGYILVQ